MISIQTTFDFNNPPSGRIYKKSSIENAINEYCKKVNNNTCLGEISHPDNGININHTNINLMNVSHKINAIVNEDGIVNISADILDTPMGKVVQEYITKTKINPNDSINMVPNMIVVSEPDIDENGNELNTYHDVIQNIVSWDIDIKK